MAFPSTAPSTRSVNYGDYPVKSVQMMDGFETRILYGSKRVGVELQLAYNNIADAIAEQFLSDYDTQRGTFGTFPLPSSTTDGMEQGLANQIPGVSDTQWRYAGPPTVNSVYPGVSSVTVTLLAVLV